MPVSVSVGTHSFLGGGSSYDAIDCFGNCGSRDVGSKRLSKGDSFRVFLGVLCFRFHLLKSSR